MLKALRWTDSADFVVGHLFLLPMLKGNEQLGFRARARARELLNFAPGYVIINHRRQRCKYESSRKKLIFLISSFKYCFMQFFLFMKCSLGQ